VLVRIVIHLLAFGGGFAVMSLELLGGRIVAPYFGSGIYVWGSIITVFMTALSIGYLLGGRLSMVRPTLSLFGFFFLGAAALLYPLVLYGEPLMQLVFNHVEDPRYGSLLAGTALFVLPTIVLGIISPYAVRLCVTETHSSGNVAGTLYFVSTLGSALGTLATSFYFVLWFEIDTIITLLSVALVAMWLIALATARLR
jgi:hypothetical protein